MAFGIGELSRRSECNIETIRYYERTGLLPAANRRGRNREYDICDVERLRFVRFARSMGFVAGDILSLLRVRDGQSNCDEARLIGTERLKDVRNAIARLQHWERWLEETLESCREPTDEHCPVVDAIAAESRGAGLR